MIKVGDKVVCIKSIQIITQEFHKDKFYEISSTDRNGADLYVKGENFMGPGIYGYWFRRDKHGNSRYKFEDYFLTLAGWRDRQIDNILEDD